LSEIVADASVALCWLVREEQTTIANNLIAAGARAEPFGCVYLALARRRAAPLVTLDQEFATRLAKTRFSSDVVHLVDWE
jgi:predicted nucleic acid-binding protein